MDSIRSNDFVIGYGGDEFLIVLQNCSEETGHIIIDRIAQSLNIYRDFVLRISYGMHVTVVLLKNYKRSR
jgi:GGDEF domain-containing protein